MIERKFQLEDASSGKMRRALSLWYELYYGRGEREGYDGCLQIPYTIVRKLTAAVLSQFEVGGEGFTGQLLQSLAALAREAVAQTLIAGEAYLKFDGQGFRCVPRANISVISRDHRGEPLEVVMAEKSRLGGGFYTLLERRVLIGDLLRVENRLFRSASPGSLGSEVPLHSHPQYAGLASSYVYSQKMENVGLVRVRTPMVNCVDGSAEGVSVYAAAVDLIRRIGENEAQLAGEFRRGQSRLVVSRDMLRDGALEDELFVGLDEDPDRVGITVFAPELREQSYLNRQQAYLRAVENVIGLKRGLLSQVEAVQRTATEITSSEGEYAMTIRDFQRMWRDAVVAAVRMAGAITGRDTGECRISFGDGVIWNEM